MFKIILLHDVETDDCATESYDEDNCDDDDDYDEYNDDDDDNDDDDGNHDV
jgi:hypothetical protein